MITQAEINDAVMTILQNTEQLPMETLERISFAVWAELQDREFEGE